MTAAAPQTTEWSRFHRAAFRFLFGYLALSAFPLVQTQRILYPEWLHTLIIGAWQVPVSWLGIHVLHLKIAPIAGLSSDTPYEYIRLACTIALACVIAVVWSLLDQRQNYRVLHRWTRVWIRYALAFVLLSYGLIKVIKLQFPDLQVNDLVAPYGASDPFTLLENFMGFSTAYTFFGGAGEMLAAVLLFFNRTTTLGALVAMAVLTNVVMLNYSYYFGALLLSLQLLLLSFVLLAPDLRRLANLLVLNRPTQPVAPTPIHSNAWMHGGALTLKVLLIGFVLTSELYDARDQYESQLPPAPPRGLYAVTSFQQRGKEVWNGSRWTTFALGRRGNVWMHSMDDSTQYFRVNGDATKEPFTITPRDGQHAADGSAHPVGALRLTVLAGSLTSLDGTFAGVPLKVSLRRLAVSDFPLMAERSHWVRASFGVPQ